MSCDENAILAVFYQFETTYVIDRLSIFVEKKKQIKPHAKLFSVYTIYILHTCTQARNNFVNWQNALCCCAYSQMNPICNL